ncbi:glutathione binding-like protein [Roseofilum sp. Belize Diploria]|uniref:glutathione binding-like protein n=2 Tax=unclassified Roseofilum TaxID=2620099 RepID=UPI00298D90AD|nr:glutathione binding-like protein [Roseofilum sp. Belize Diploria]
MSRFVRILALPTLQPLEASIFAETNRTNTSGYKALSVMEQQLSKTDFLVNGSLTIADISLYAYTHVADEGGFDLSEYPAVRAWLDRVSSHPHHLTLS